MDEGQHRRKYESFDKLTFYVAGISLLTLMTVQVNFTGKLIDGQNVNNKTLASVTEQIKNVMRNQDALNRTVDNINAKVIRLRERQFLHQSYFDAQK